MPAENLIAVPKEISRAGATFTQRYWVKAGDVAKQMKEKGWNPGSPGSDKSLQAFRDTVKSLGGSGQLAEQISRAWTGSCNADKAVRAQAVVAKMLGRPMEEIPYAKSGAAAGTFKQQFELDANDAEAKKYEKAISGTYAVTQAALADKPEVMRLYRGVKGKIADAVLERAIALADKGVPYDEAKLGVDFNPISCFTESKATAASFGSSGVVFHMDVPKDAVLFAHQVSPGHCDSYKGEQEMSVMCGGPTELSMHQLGGETGAKIYNYFASKGLTGTPVSDKPAAKGAPPVKVKITASKEDLEAAGGKVIKTSGSSGWEPNVEIPADKVHEFAEKFSKTASFDPKTKTVEGLSSYLKGKATEAASAAEVSSGSKAGGSMWTPPEPSGKPSAPAASAEEQAKAGTSFEAPKHGEQDGSGYTFNAKAGKNGIWEKDKKSKAAAPKAAAIDVSGEEDKQESALKGHALKAMGYQPNKKNLEPHEQKILDTAVAAAHEEAGLGVYDMPKEKLKALVDKHVQKAADDAGGKGMSERELKWKKGFEEAGKALDEHTTESTPEVEHALLGELAEKKPAYREKWWAAATKTMKKMDLPKEQHAETFEKVQAQAKVVFAKKYLKGEKLSKKGTLAVLKKLTEKALTK